MSRRVPWLCALALGGAFSACSADHSALEKKPDGRGGSNAGGASGIAGTFAQVGGSGAAPASGGGHPDDEAPGTSVLTFVNGVVDAPRVALCFAKVDAEGSVTPFGDLLGDGPIEYGQALVLHEISGSDFDRDTLQPSVIAGELGLIDGLDCAAAIERARSEEALNDGSGGASSAGGDGSSAGDGNGGDFGSGGVYASAGARAEGGATPEAGAGGVGGVVGAPRVEVRARLRVRALPAISAGTLSAGRSLALVANGCLGGATFRSSASEQYCGAGYTPREPTVSAILVSLSRQIAFDHVGMQFVHASLANGALALSSQPSPPATNDAISIAANVVPGQVAPHPATVFSTAFDYGADRRFQLEVSSQGAVLFSRTWSSALELGNLTELSDGSTYAVVLSGPRGDLPAQPNLWNAPALTVIAADPQR